MVKVLKQSRRRTSTIIICERCNSILEATLDGVEYYTEKDPKTGYNDCIICPVCARKNFIDVNKQFPWEYIN